MNVRNCTGTLPVKSCSIKNSGRNFRGGRTARPFSFAHMHNCSASAGSRSKL